MKKIGNWPITEADTDFSKMSTKNQLNRTEFDEFWNFMSAHFGTVTQCSVEPTVPKCAHKIILQLLYAKKYMTNYKLFWMK